MEDGSKQSIDPSTQTYENVDLGIDIATRVWTCES